MQARTWSTESRAGVTTTEMTSLRLCTFLFFICIGSTLASESGDGFALDHRYAPTSWQTAICLPDDWQKTLVHKDGTLLYDYGGKHAGFGTRISFRLEGDSKWVKQEL